MRILAGIQETKFVENSLHRLLEDERQTALENAKRIIDEKKTVVTNFDIFKTRIDSYLCMLECVTAIFNSNNHTEFMKGIQESKYENLQKFADIVINDDISKVFSYLDAHYCILKEEMDTISLLVESVDEDGGTTYFASTDLFSDMLPENVEISLFKNRLMEKPICNDIPYGSEIVFLNENLSVVKFNGKKYYAKFSQKNITMLEKHGFLI